MDGIDIAQALDMQTNIPFIFLTAHAEDAILKRVKGTLQYGYIKKPFTDEDLRIGIELAFAKSRFIHHILTNNAWYEMVLNHFPLGVVIADNEGILTYLNANARSLLQWQGPLGTVHFREIVTIVDGPYGKPLENIYGRIKEEQSTLWILHHAVLITINKNQQPVAGNATPLFNDKGERVGMVLTLFALGNKNYFRTLS
jgi:CheY-like chemotaxis protein